MFPKFARILLVRTDRIGDLVLTTPAIAAIKEKLPEAEFTALVAHSCQDVVAGNPALNKIITYQPLQHSGPLGFFRLLLLLRQERFDAAVVFQTTFPIACAIFSAEFVTEWGRFQNGGHGFFIIGAVGEIGLL